MTRIIEPALLVGIGDESGLDQHRWHIRRAQHHEVGPLDMGLWVLPRRLSPESTCPAMSSEAFIVALCDKSSSTEAKVLSLSCRRTPPTRSRLFLTGQPARSLRRSPALRQHEHRRTAGGRIGEGVGVDGHEQVGLGCPRLLVALRQRDENVGVAGQIGLQARRGVDLPRQLRAICKCDFLLATAGRTACSGSWPPWPASTAITSGPCRHASVAASTWSRPAAGSWRPGPWPRLKRVGIARGNVWLPVCACGCSGDAGSGGEMVLADLALAGTPVAAGRAATNRAVAAAEAMEGSIGPERSAE